MNDNGAAAARGHQDEQGVDLGFGSLRKTEQQIENGRNRQRQVADAVADPDTERGSHQMRGRHHHRQRDQIERDRKRLRRRMGCGEPAVARNGDQQAAGKAGETGEDQRALEQALLVAAGIFAPRPHHQDLLTEGRDDAEQAGGAEQDRVDPKGISAKRARGSEISAKFSAVIVTRSTNTPAIPSIAGLERSFWYWPSAALSFTVPTSV
jgi:hypothetical protein